jgi:hypothetical protein
MINFRFCIIGVLLCLTSQILFAQVPIGSGEQWGADLDSLRNAEELKEDSVIYNASYIRYTTLDRMKLGTYTVQIDTGLRGFQYFNPQNDPYNPSINTGSYGLATRDLLFNPSKTIGFQTGFHSLERYLLNPDSIRYYRARSPFSELGFVTGDQVFKATVAQNVTPRWSVGGELNFALAKGFYQNQRYNDSKAAVFSWYESENNRYNLLTNLVFNTLVSTENGSVLNDTLFQGKGRQASEAEIVRLSGQREERARQTWKDYNFFLRQSFFIGRIDSINAGTQEMQILPTQRVSHTLQLNSKKFQFYKNEDDANSAFPFTQNPAILTKDSTRLKSISNEFGYSFYLRGKSTSFIKNEVKLDLRLQNEISWFNAKDDKFSFQNTTLKAGIGYRFSDRVNIVGDLNQIVAGRNFGDYFYEANANFLLSNTVGRVILGGYIQNKSPDYLFERVNYQYHKWPEAGNDAFNFDKTKINNLSFTYENSKLGFTGKVEYFLMNNYLYYKEIDNPALTDILRRKIEPAQITGNINMLKISVGEKLTFGRFHFDNYAVYQKSDYMSVLQTPELYTWHSFYYNNILVKVVNFNIGFDVRFNTPFVAPSYAINVSQFYNDNADIEFSTYPVVDLWLTATLKRTNFFLRYDYANQGLLSNGYYTVRRYPMGNANLRFGLTWKFYD